MKPSEPPKPRGRPRQSAEPLETVSVRLAPPQYNRLCQLALARDTSLSKTLRDLLGPRLR